MSDLIDRAEAMAEERTETHACDCISRQVAIDAIFSEPLYKPGMKKRDADEVVPAIYEKIKSSPPAQPEPQWIPCSERLPEEKDAGILKKLGTNKRSDYVIATVEAKGERMTVTACTYDGAWDWNMKYAFPDYKIIAWMPLPDPYKERGGE